MLACNLRIAICASSEAAEAWSETDETTTMWMLPGIRRRLVIVVDVSILSTVIISCLIVNAIPVCTNMYDIE